MVMKVPWLDAQKMTFPDIEQALEDPGGLLAAGGDLSVERLLLAYRSGIFPWYSEDQPILWWSPAPRGVLYPHDLKISRSLTKVLKRQTFSVHVNRDFPAVIKACSEARSYADSTWITTEMQAAYIRLHEHGYAHSIECYQGDKLAGGLYGLGLGNLFFGESMFHVVTDASKVAFAHLTRLMLSFDCPLIDCQLDNSHLQTLGVCEIPRQKFRSVIEKHAQPSYQIDWTQVPSALPAW
jgi:leucyl/phenylalanyl-tRNA--protein transferase